MWGNDVFPFSINQETIVNFFHPLNYIFFRAFFFFFFSFKFHISLKYAHKGNLKRFEIFLLFSSLILIINIIQRDV